MHRLSRWLVLATAVVLPFASGGCWGYGLLTFIPVQPWVPDWIERRLNNQSDVQTPILPPIPPGHRPLCEDPPDRAQILRAMPHVLRGIPYVLEEFRDDIEFTVEKIADHVDPPRFFPLIGPAQLHHCHWKCTIYYTQTLEACHPFPFFSKRRRVEVIYIDRDHLHQCITGPDAQMSVGRDLVGSRP